MNRLDFQNKCCKNLSNLAPALLWSLLTSLSVQAGNPLWLRPSYRLFQSIGAVADGGKDVGLAETHVVHTRLCCKCLWRPIKRHQGFEEKKNTCNILYVSNPWIQESRRRFTCIATGNVRTLPCTNRSFPTLYKCLCCPEYREDATKSRLSAKPDSYAVILNEHSASCSRASILLCSRWVTKRMWLEEVCINFIEKIVVQRHFYSSLSTKVCSRQLIRT